MGAADRPQRRRGRAPGRADQAGRDRPRRDLDRHPAAARRDRAAGSRSRSAPGRRLRRDARRVRGRRRPLGHRRRDRRGPEVSELPVGAGADHLQRTGRGRRPGPADQGAEQLPRPRSARRLLEPRALQPSHGAHGDGVRLTRSTPRRARRGSRGALRATSPPRRRAARRARRLGVDALRQGAPPAPASTRPCPITPPPAPPDPATAPTTSAPPESAGYEPPEAYESSLSSGGFAAAIESWGEAGRERAAGPLRPSEGGRSPPPSEGPARSRPGPQDAPPSEVAGRRAAAPPAPPEPRGGPGA